MELQREVSSPQTKQKKWIVLPRFTKMIEIFPKVTPITMLIDYEYSFRTQDKRSSGMFWIKRGATSDSYVNLQI